ncbi:MAG: hypothetical protein R2827_15120 [Bdellovibrionales bacterium]
MGYDNAAKIAKNGL